MIRPRSLQHRLVLFMLLPVAVLLFSMGFAGFIYARKSLLLQWEEATMLKLERAAHFVDMRLSRPKELLEFCNKAADKPYAPYIRESVVEQLNELEGVVRVRLTWLDRQLDRDIHPGRDQHMGTGSQLPSMGPGRQVLGRTVACFFYSQLPFNALPA